MVYVWIKVSHQEHDNFRMHRVCIPVYIWQESQSFRFFFGGVVWIFFVFCGSHIVVEVRQCVVPGFPRFPPGRQAHGIIRFNQIQSGTEDFGEVKPVTCVVTSANIRRLHLTETKPQRNNEFTKNFS